MWPRFALPLPHQIPAAHPRSHAASKPLSRPASAQPLANPPTHHSKRKRSAPRGYNDPDPQQHQEDDPEDYQPQRRPSSANPTWPRHSRAVRSGPGAGRKGPGEMHAEHSRDYGGNAATSSQSVDDTPASSRLQRVLRSRGGRGKSAEQAAALRVANWGAAGQVQGSDSQGHTLLNQ